MRGKYHLTWSLDLVIHSVKMVLLEMDRETDLVSPPKPQSQGLRSFTYSSPQLEFGETY